MIQQGYNDMGAMISGKWMNKINGNVINVRDTTIDGDSMILMTDQGMLSMEEFTNNYIQVSDEIYDESGNVIKNEKPQISEIIQSPKAPNNTSHMLPTDAQDFLEHKTTNNTPKENEQNTYQDNIIKKFFDKIDSKPTINISIIWDELPINELNTLVKFLDIDKKDIAQFIIDKYLNREQITNAMEKKLDKLK